MPSADRSRCSTRSKLSSSSATSPAASGVLQELRNARCALISNRPCRLITARPLTTLVLVCMRSPVAPAVNGGPEADFRARCSDADRAAAEGGEMHDQAARYLVQGKHFLGSPQRDRLLRHAEHDAGRFV